LAGKVFINYRREDDQGNAGRLYDRLEAELGAGRIFMDVEGHIKGGDDFVDVLRAQVAACDVLLAIIGPRWLTIADETARRRLDNPDDWVRVEIAGALEMGKRVIPVLVGGAEMPRADGLPEPLKPLARRQAIRITPERFKADTLGLVDHIKAALGEVEGARPAAIGAERAAVAALVRGRQAEEAARLLGRERQDAEAHLVWMGLNRSDKRALQAFLDEFPEAPEAGAAHAALSAIVARETMERMAAERRGRESGGWAAVAGSVDKAEVEAFLRTWPDGAHAHDAEARLAELRGGGWFSRRRLLKGAAIGVGGAAAALVTFVPGMPVWRLLHDRSIRTFTGHSAPVESVAFAPDGRTALSGSWDTTLKLWDVATGRVLRTFTGHLDWVRAVAFAPDGRTALSGSNDRAVRLWDVATGRELRTFTGHSSTVGAVAFSPDGRTALSGSSEAIRWDVATGSVLRTFDLSVGGEAVAFAPDGRTALADSWENTLKLWDVETGQALRTLTGHSSYVGAVAFAPDGRTALSGSRDNTVKLWDLATGRALRTFSGHSAPVEAVAFAPDGRTALSGSRDNTVKLWDVETGHVLRIFTGHAGPAGPHPLIFFLTTGVVRAVAFAPEGRTALSGSWDKTLKLWEVTR
jgi:hypothetical protein